MTDGEQKLQMTAPVSCPLCGMTPDQMQEEYGVKWLLYELQGTTFIMFQCPNCNVMCGNTSAIPNREIILKQQEEMEKRAPIVKPSKNLIILPGHGNVSKN